MKKIIHWALCVLVLTAVGYSVVIIVQETIAEDQPSYRP